MERATRREGRQAMRRSIALVLGSAPWLAAAYVAVLAVNNLLPVLQVWLTQRLVNALVLVHAAPATADAAITLGMAYAATLLLPAALWPVQVVAMATLMDRTVAAVDRRLMDAGARMSDLMRIERPDFSDELRLAQDAAGRAPQLFQALQWIVGQTLTLGGLLLLLARLNPWLPLALLVASLPRLVVERRLNRLRWQVMVDHSRAAREMDYCASVTTEPTAAKEVRVFGVGDYFLGRFEARRAVAQAEVGRLRLAELRLFALFGGLHALVLAGGLWYVATEAGAGRLTLGAIALYLNAVIQAENRLLFLANWIGILNETLLRLGSMFGFLDAARPAIALPASATDAPAADGGQAAIELRAVSFRYPKSTAPVLEQVSAVLPAGKVTALVGANGAGKSTLVKLLTRMYDLTGGEILLDGMPLAAYDLDVLRRRVAVVYQDFAHFALTLGENIAVGAAASGGTGHLESGRVEQAARRAGADAVAAKLPGGYATELTRQFAGGVDLSGGEWQKVALARAFVRDAALIIMDEPTAALDADAEYQLFHQFRELVAGKTALLISHRFSTVRMADRILVLEGGKIIEAGSHEELIALGGRYANLYEMQAGRYR